MPAYWPWYFVEMSELFSSAKEIERRRFSSDRRQIIYKESEIPLTISSVSGAYTRRGLRPASQLFDGTNTTHC